MLSVIRINLSFIFVSNQYRNTHGWSEAEVDIERKLKAFEEQSHLSVVGFDIFAAYALV